MKDSYHTFQNITIQPGRLEDIQKLALFSEIWVILLYDISLRFYKPITYLQHFYGAAILDD